MNSRSRYAADIIVNFTAGDEAEWWKKVGIDPTDWARTLWLASHPHPVTAKVEGVGG